MRSAFVVDVETSTVKRQSSSDPVENKLRITFGRSLFGIAGHGCFTEIVTWASDSQTTKLSISQNQFIQNADTNACSTRIGVSTRQPDGPAQPDDNEVSGIAHQSQ